MLLETGRTALGNNYGVDLVMENTSPRHSASTYDKEWGMTIN